MAVIVRETIDLGAGPQEVRVFLPKGVLSKSEREQAERLDTYLTKLLPRIYEDMNVLLEQWCREVEFTRLKNMTK